MAFPLMIKGAQPPPKQSGVGVLFTTYKGKSYAFISEVADLRARRVAWEFHFRNRYNRDYVPVVSRNIPDIDAEHWEYRFWIRKDSTLTGRVVTDMFREKGYEILSNEDRERNFTHEGKTGTLAALCREFGVNYQKAYYRIARKGETFAEVFSEL